MQLSPAAVEVHAGSFRQYHDEVRDCRILAEAELGGLAVLLTFDRTFWNRLRNRLARVRVRYPSEYGGLPWGPQEE